MFKHLKCEKKNVKTEFDLDDGSESCRKEANNLTNVRERVLGLVEVQQTNLHSFVSQLKSLLLSSVFKQAGKSELEQNFRTQTII